MAVAGLPGWLSSAGFLSVGDNGALATMNSGYEATFLCRTVQFAKMFPGSCGHDDNFAVPVRASGLLKSQSKGGLSRSSLAAWANALLLDVLIICFLVQCLCNSLETILGTFMCDC